MEPMYPPLALLKKMTAKYPNAWEQMEEFHAQNGKNGLPSWEPWCYAPISAAMAVTMDGMEDSYESRLATMKDSQIIAALAPWRRSKEVFVIDPDLEGLLFSQSEDLTINSEILFQIPYPCFYIQFSQLFDFLGNLCHGVFVHLEDDVNTHDKELRLLYLRPDGHTIGEPIHIGEETLEESLNHTRTEAFRNIPEDRADFRRMLLSGFENLEQEIAAYRKTLQIILYLCAQNAEIAPNSEQAFITKKSSTGRIRDRYAEIRKWDVGFRIGAAVRKARELPKEPHETTHSGTGPATHASPRPHMRRAHWHNFWTGPKSEPNSRKLVLKWVAPTIVGVSAEEAPVVIHLAKKEK